MKTQTFDQNLNALRIYSEDRVPNTMFPLVRLKIRHLKQDVSGTDAEYQKAITETVMNLVERFHAVYAVTFNDEISLLLPRGYTQFDRRVERLLSSITSFAASSLTLDFDANFELTGP